MFPAISRNISRGTLRDVSRDTSRDIPQIERVIGLLLISMLIGCLVATVYAMQASGWSQFISMVAVALTVAGAASLSGGLLGFLFGIPRTLQQDSARDLQNARLENPAADKPPPISYQMNTNLEQISDWLTKILVGVGLTQLSALPDALHSYAEYTAIGLGNLAGSRIFSVALLTYFLVCGFLVSYLWTRSYLAGALREADMAVIGASLDKVKQEIAEVESKVTELEKQAALDARAMLVVQRQLNPGVDDLPVSQEDINDAVKPASPHIKEQIFQDAANIRSENWRDQLTKPKMERTIPVFRALIASSLEHPYHVFHGQLGFALKDSVNPDWVDAESELSRAIELRGPVQRRTLLYYEFVRVICRINLDEAFKQDKATAETTRQIIIADIKAVATVPDIFQRLVNELNFSKWMKLNKLTPQMIINSDSTENL